jgi:hypothetical protein
MIRYALVCDKRHAFEVWFASSTDYDKQKKRKLVSCPVCGSIKVDKAIMAPSIASTRRRRETAAITNEPAHAPQSAGAEPTSLVAMMSPEESEFRAKLRDLRDHLVRNAENVGTKFAEEARKMHYGEIERRSIYGEASPEEAKEMAEEGVEFYALPALPDDRN